MSAGQGGEGDLLPPEAAIADYLTSLLGVATAPEPAVSWCVFEIAGLRLALPAAECGECLEPDRESLATLGAEGFAADVQVGGRTLRLIHLFHLLVPAARRSPDRRGGVPLGGLAVPLRAGQYALLVAGERPDVTPKPESIVWRSAQTSRPWLAGVDRDNGIVLLDVQAIIQLFEIK